MTTLYRRLLTSMKQWWESRRDYRLLMAFLKYPSASNPAIKSATPAARLLMYSLLEFARSELEKVDVSIIGSAMWCSLPGHLPVPSNVFETWRDLSLASRLEFVLKMDGAPATVFVWFPFQIPAVVLPLNQPPTSEPPAPVLGQDDIVMVLSKKSDIPNSYRRCTTVSA